MELIAIKAFTDNYIWMLHKDGQAIVVDPGDAAPVLHALKERRLELAAILVTHHHADHVGGLAELAPLLRQTETSPPIYGPAAERIPGPHIALAGGDRLSLLGQALRVLEVPGHTAGHIAYLIDAPSDGGEPILFCGDTLFSGGCGRLFEGTAAQMYNSLQTLAALPGGTRVCCAHEYTLSNLRFACAVEPGNKVLTDYQRWCEAQRAMDLPTLPSSIGRELAVNPFLRCEEVEVRHSALQWHDQHLTHGTSLIEPTPAQSALAAGASSIAVFACLRQWKNEFK
ncbi:MAG: hydroxyacylglutathione hydrolase [Burkholderiaceae bacterium]|nr:hydroxyacylglutathione hydrolase [Roseateles sp.]MBV8470172.1 hydroxyacylglutathione hydrolase [Burkholderiaceae bacterium]